MKKSILACTMAVCLFSLNKINAQWVTIPDANFVSYLQGHFPSCMSGNQMDTTCSAVVTATDVALVGWHISDLYGIQFFDSLHVLNCSTNLLTGLPTLPSGLTSLYCNINYLTSLPTLPPGLIDVSCASNNLTNLPTLPPGLVYLGCYDNPIITLPTLPASIQELRCDTTSLTALPALPNGLSIFSCSNCSLTSLPTLPPTLTQLICFDNQLTFLPTLPPLLHFLHCSFNNLTNIPNIPSGLHDLVCDNNHLTFLPALPASLTVLSCKNNNLTCLPEIPAMIGYLYITNNQLECVPNHPVPGTWSDTAVHTIPLCSPSFNPNGCPMYHNISGNIYDDQNLNCTEDSAESSLINIPVDLYQSGNLLQQTFTSLGGYTFSAPLGNYDVIIDTVGTPFQESCINPGLDTNVNLSAIDSIAEHLDIGLICKPGYDAGVFSIVHTNGQIFPGQNFTLHALAGDAALQYGVTCNTAGVSGSVQITVNGPISYVSPAAGSLIPSVSGNIFTYTISDLSTVEIDSSFGLIFLTDTTALAGTPVCVDAIVTTSGTEYNSSNNSLTHCFVVVNSLDPNGKEVFPSGDVSYPYNDWFTYTIHFQNTGTAPAIHINIQDTLDADLDPSTFRLLNYSHPVDVNIIGNIARFSFYNINLTDSTTNEPLSNGYIQYKIKSNGTLPIGSTIDNTAHIYFDYNPAVITNTVNTTIVLPVNTSGIESQSLINSKLYPNPANDKLFINFSNIAEKRTIELYDLFGQQLSSIFSSDKTVSFAVDNLVNGVYIIRVIEKNSTTSHKVIVQH